MFTISRIPAATRAWLLCAALALTLPTACGQRDIGDVESVEQIDPGVRNARRAVRSDFAALAAARKRELIADSALETLLTTDAPPVGLVRRQQLASLYRARDFEPVFLTDGQPNFRALAVLELAADAHRHALPVSRYLRPALLSQLRRTEELRSVIDRLPELRLSSADMSVVDELLSSDAIREAPHATAALLDRLLPHDAGRDAPLPELAAAWHQRILLERAIRGHEALLEATLADVWLELAADFRDSNWVAVNDKATADEQTRILTRRSRESFTELADAAGLESARAVVSARIPRFEQYGRLLEALERYREIVANGGWEELTPTTLSRGSRGAIVAALKRRLQAEGYFTGDINDVFDRDLEEAVTAYQNTHQLEANGRSSRDFWTSLNVSAQERLAQIELTIQRWRESRIGDDDYYFLVNIPDFHAELWRNGERERRFRIVVGNTQRECRNERMTYVNATPLQTAEMSYVVINPYWVVPQRIMREELLPAALNNPNFWQDNGYEHVPLPGGGAMVRQLPGDNNALGAVKFIFPNEHDTYMHDTPRRQYFNYPVRAFSHGCMRVQDPIGLLEHILTNDGQWDPAQFQRTRGHGRESRVNLRTPIPVHIEYYVVRVDDDGHAHFNADIYRHDRARMDMRFEREERCTPRPARQPPLSLSADGTILTRDASGQLVSARELAEREAAAQQQQQLPGLPGQPGAATNNNNAPAAMPLALPGDFGP